MSKFFCDSNCELNYKLVEKYGITVIYMPYTIDGEEHFFDMGKTFDAKNFYKQLKDGKTPATQALNPQNYIDYFEPVLASGEDILYVSFSDKMSGTFAYYDTAVEELKQKYPERTIKRVTTLGITWCAGVQVLLAAKMHSEGASDDEIIDWVTNNRQNFALYFCVDDLNFLKRGGRISNSQAFFGGLLGIKPILKCDSEGKIVSCGKEKGKKKAMMYLIDIVKEIGTNIADYPIIIEHADAEEDALFLKQKLLEYIDGDCDISIYPVGPTIGCHCGPGTVGICFRSTKR